MVVDFPRGHKYHHHWLHTGDIRILLLRRDRLEKHALLADGHSVTQVRVWSARLAEASTVEPLSKNADGGHKHATASLIYA